MTGRYIRTTYSRLESLYLQYYELPAVFRAFSRTAAQITVLLILSKASEFLLQTVRLCKCGYHCRWWCALIWISLVVGIGQIFASLVAQWGGPLRIQVISSQSHTSRNFAARVFTQPWHILQWMRDPEAWISMVASNPQSSSRLLQPYTANPILFPTTWAPIKVFSVLAVCKVRT